MHHFKVVIYFESCKASGGDGGSGGGGGGGGGGSGGPGGRVSLSLSLSFLVWLLSSPTWRRLPVEAYNKLGQIFRKTSTLLRAKCTQLTLAFIQWLNQMW